ncbi:HAD hydrolase, family IA [Propionibacterium sp. oral taxon 192 str. F0372]|uniref:HAD family hydrolase n=1 Tax=Propionibacterium sp. oral taxon 192 TaxID=671222 RepID=UPI000353DBD3|nr:HAD family phosphatase [Propionibacterium sp. oral taxon 192]EPH06791.1 HAD hydrolase, family IA [Propionibacterium sp. oral taxon 192 str. F0372]
MSKASPFLLFRDNGHPPTVIISDNGAMTLRAVIFDMDGTLTDSEEWWDELRRGLAAEEGIAWPIGATDAMMGMSTREWSAYMTTVVGVSGTPEQVAEHTIAGMLAKYRAGVPLLPGADAAVRMAAGRWKTGICSSSPQALIESVASETGWIELLGAIVSTELVAAGKPAPDGYLRVAELLEVDPAGCVVIEDSANGVTSALAAGMKVVEVLPRFNPPSGELLARCDLVVDSLEMITPKMLALLH